MYVIEEQRHCIRIVRSMFVAEIEDVAELSPGLVRHSLFGWSNQEHRNSSPMSHDGNFIGFPCESFPLCWLSQNPDRRVGGGDRWSHNGTIAGGL